MIKKLSILLLLFVLLCYFVAAATVISRPNRKVLCRAIEVIVADSSMAGFIRTTEVLTMLEKQGIHPGDLLTDSISLKAIDSILIANPWIEKSVSYKTPGGKICIRLNQRRPLLRIMDVYGGDYFVDAEGAVIPKAPVFADLMVVTGFVTPRLVHDNLIELGLYIQGDSFWNNQIQQINVLSNGEVELIPRVGGHSILIGRPSDISAKLSRMKHFYSLGLAQTGWNKYKQIDLRYNNQIICKRK